MIVECLILFFLTDNAYDRAFFSRIDRRKPRLEVDEKASRSVYAVLFF
jgi:hypothetical protein